MAYNKYARKCDECGAGMNEGYCIEAGCEYYCSDACLHKHYTPEEWDKLYAEGDGDSYWTTWDEDPDEYMVNEDDPAPNKMSVEMVDIFLVLPLWVTPLAGIGFIDEANARFRKQLRDRGLDPDKYEFINWTVTCDVQIKEENKV